MDELFSVVSNRYLDIWTNRKDSVIRSKQEAQSLNAAIRTLVGEATYFRKSLRVGVTYLPG